MHNRSSFRFLFFVLFATFFIVACSKNEKKKSETILNTEKNTQKQIAKTEPPIQDEKEKWFFFSHSTGGTLNIKQIKSISNVPEEEFKPWTEATRITSVGLMYNPPLFLINKGGIIEADKIGKTQTLAISHIIQDKTIDGFYKTNLGTVIRTYTNTIFSFIHNTAEENFCLYRYNTVNKEIQPLISTQNFQLKPEAQLVSLEFNNKWLASFKTEINEKVDFNYFSFNSLKDVQNGNYKIISQTYFRDNIPKLTITKNNFNKKEIAKTILNDEYKNIKTEFFSNNLKKKIIFTKKEVAEIQDQSEISAVACEFKNGIDSKLTKAILLSTGKLYYSIDNKNWQNLRLPKLPENFAYTYFAIIDNTIIASWEEQKFFQVGRAGFLKLNLMKLNQK